MGRFPAVSLLALFDIHFGRTGEDDPDTGVSEAQVRKVVGLGGTVVYRHHLNSLRAILPLEAAEKVGASLVEGVFDASRTELPVAVGFHQSADPALITALGGQVIHVFQQIAAVFGTVPDEAIPLLRQHANVRYVEWSGVGCFQLDAPDK